MQPDPRGDFQARIYQRLTDTGETRDRAVLAAPHGLRAEAATGHVRLSWEPVPGAAGYVVERTDPGRPPLVLDHGGADVPAVPSHEFADTGLAEGATFGYRVGAVANAEDPVWAWSDPVTVTTAAGQSPGEPNVDVTVDAAAVTGRLRRPWRMIGAERLSQLLLSGEQKWIADEFEAALRRVHDDLGVDYVRAHAILHDDLGVVSRAGDGTLRYDFDRVDAVYDKLRDIGVRPVVELSFMPAALARDPSQTVFTYRGIISPPADWSQWRELIHALVAHLVDRYGIDEVEHWPFEVWNEANLAVFWTGTADEYLRLYDEAAAAVKSVDARLRVGGPSTAAAEWVERLAAHCAAGGVPLDFVTSHTYGNLPLDVRPALARHGFADAPVWWTEWGVGSTHFGPIHDTAFGAPFVLAGYHLAQRHPDALAYWTASDHFEELGRPDRLFHNGFGLLTVGNLGKPRFWAAYLAAHQGEQVLACEVTGDGAGVLVRASATVHDDGTVDILAWNGTVNAALMGGDPRLDREVSVLVRGLADGVAYDIDLTRVDARHSNIAADVAPDLVWPDDGRWARLRDRDHLDGETLPPRPPGRRPAVIDFRLPMPGVARVRLRPVSARSAPRTAGPTTQQEGKE